jgi:hypothetical protein
MKLMKMTKLVLFVLICFSLVLATQNSVAQCSICTKTASQLGEKPAKGLNTGIIYLMLTPFAVGGYIGYRWWKREKALMEDEEK